MLITSSYYEMRNANDAKYAQIRQRHLDAIVQSMIPSIDNTRTSEVSTGEIDQLAQQIRKISSSIATQEDLQKAIDAINTAITDKFQAMLSDIWNRYSELSCMLRERQEWRNRS